MFHNHCYRDKWTQTRREFWATSIPDLAEFFQSLFKEEVRSGNAKVATREDMDCRVAQSRTDCAITAIDAQISDLAPGRPIRIPRKPPPRDKTSDDSARSDYHRIKHGRHHGEPRLSWHKQGRCDGDNYRRDCHCQ